MQFWEDIRYALRQFAKAPGFTVTAVLTLALGIGATTAIFTLVHAVLLKSLPVTKPGELYRIGDVENCCVNGGLQDNYSLFSYDKYKTFRDRTPGFADLAAMQSGHTLVGVRRNGTNQPAASYISEFVSGNYFPMFGISAYAGRMLTPQDDRKGAPPAAVMSFRTWQEKFAQDRSVVGTSFVINGQPFTIVGITPPGYYGDRVQSNPPAFYLPINTEPVVTGTNSILEQPELDWLDLIGRIIPGANPKTIEAQLQVELKQWLLSPISKLSPAEMTMVPKQTLHLSPGGGGIQQMRDEYKDGLHLLMWVSGFVLLIACANLANLMLVRATTRKQQTSIRAALGAPRRRQVRQALTESVVLGLLGGIAGVALAFAGTKMILNLAFPEKFVPIHATLSLPVLEFALAASLLTGILFGIAPALITAHAAPVEALRGANRATGRSGAWGQKSLVIIQAALSLVLLCAAGLLTRSLSNMQHQHFGFDTTNRYIAHIDPQMAGYKPAQLEVFFRQLHDMLAAIPGVKQVSFSIYSPMEGDNWGETVYINGQPPPPPDSNQNNASWVRATPGYFDTIGTKLIEGRSFTEQDTSTTRAVAVVNRTFAKKFFKNESAIGKRFGDLDAKYSGDFEIVGVTEDTQYWDAASKIRPMYFLAANQTAHYTDPRAIGFEDRSRYLNAIEIQTMGNVPGLEAQVRRVLGQVNPDLAVIDFTGFAEQVQHNFTQQAMIAKLTSLFGILALVLASIGLYGVTAYSVERRTSEIGIRMALGANPGKVLQLVLRGAFLQVGIGLAIGIPATILAGHFMANQLFGVKPYNIPVLLITILALSLAAFVAAVIPARRAAALDPMKALRTE